VIRAGVLNAFRDRRRPAAGRMRAKRRPKRGRRNPVVSGPVAVGQARPRGAKHCRKLHCGGIKSMILLTNIHPT